MKINGELREKIIEILTSDSRKSLRTIAKDLGVSATTVSKAVQKMEKDGVIQRYTAQVDWHKVGFDSLMCLQIVTDSDVDIEKVGSTLKKMPAVKHVFYTTGDANFSAYVVCRNNAEASATLEKLRHIQGIERIVPHVVLRTF